VSRDSQFHSTDISPSSVGLDTCPWKTASTSTPVPVRETHGHVRPRRLAPAIASQ
jgi:hypothetical protein